MTRWVALAVLVVALSATAAVVVPMLPTVASRDEHVPFPIRKEKGPAGKAVLDADPKWDFGTMAQYQIGKHTWTLKNEGQGDLELSATAVCSCTATDLPDPKEPNFTPRILKPGESYPIRLRWETRDFRDAWKRVLTVHLGNDANRERIDFTISGNIQPALLVFPPERTVYFSTIPSDQTAKGRIAFASPDRPDVKITSIRTSRPDAVTASFVPLTEEEHKNGGIPQAGGFKVNIEVLPSPDLGVFSEEVIVGTDHPLAPELRISVGGKRVGPVSVIPETVRVNQASSVEGAESSVIITVRNAPETKFEVAGAPEGLEVKVAGTDAKAKPDAKIRQYRMTVTIPAGTAPGLISGLITLKTDHPNARQIKIPVEITVKSD